MKEKEKEKENPFIEFVMYSVFAITVVWTIRWCFVPDIPGLFRLGQVLALFILGFWMISHHRDKRESKEQVEPQSDGILDQTFVLRYKASGEHGDSIFMSRPVSLVKGEKQYGMCGLRIAAYHREHHGDVVAVYFWISENGQEDSSRYYIYGSDDVAEYPEHHNWQGTLTTMLSHQSYVEYNDFVVVSSGSLIAIASVDPIVYIADKPGVIHRVILRVSVIKKPAHS